LPIVAPRDAKIVSRDTRAQATPQYTVDIGGHVLENISLDEIFDFVSEQEFEAFEHSCFRAENAERERRDAEALQAKRRRARPRQAIRTEQSSSSGEDDTSVQSASSDEAALAPIKAPVPTGRLGRPRPNYSQFYLKRPGRREGAKQKSPQSRVESAKTAGKKTEQYLSCKQLTFVTANLSAATTGLSLTEDAVPKRRKLQHQSASESESSISQANTTPQHGTSMSDLKSRGLLRKSSTNPKPAIIQRALSEEMEDIVHVSPGLTKTSSPQSASEKVTFASASKMLPPRSAPTTLQSSSKLQSAETVGLAPTRATSEAQGATTNRFSKSATDLQRESMPPSTSTQAPRQPPDRKAGDSASQPPTTKKLASTAAMHITVPKSKANTMPEPIKPTTTTSAASSNASSAPSASDASEASEESDDSQTFEIEEILAHKMSDPKTHRDPNSKPVRLYQVRWVGYPVLTWEPRESFDDETAIDAYWERVRARKGKGKWKARVVGGTA